MSINYKGIELNSPGDPAPWATIEQDAYKAVIDSVVLDTVSGSASDAKVNGHKHFKLYAETAGDLVLSIDAAHKATFTGDVQFESGLIVPAATTPGFVKNDGSGNFTFGNAAESVPGGVDTNVQYNNAGAFAGTNRMRYTGDDFTLKDGASNDTITLGSSLGLVNLQNAAGDNAVITPNEIVVYNDYDIGPNGTENSVFLDGFTNNTITGWYKPATMSLASVTTFNINTAGIAFFMKKGTYPYTYVRRNIPIQNNIVANLGLSGREIHIFVDEVGTVLQQASVTSTDLLTKCYLGNLTKNDAGDEISFETNQEPVCDSITETARVLIVLLGGIQVVNMYIGGAGLATLQVSRTAGEVIRIGIEGATDRAEPDTILVAAENPIATLSYRYVDENDEIQFYSNDTELDPTQWYRKSTTSLVNVTSNNWSGQRVYYFAASSGGTATTLIMLGNAQFNTADDAIAAMGNVDEDFSKPQALKRAVFLGWVVSRGGASNADDMGDVQYIPFNDPFELSRTGSGSSSGGSATMQSTYNSSTIPQIITDATRGAVTYRRGSAADTDNVLVVQNGAAGEVASIKGTGYVQAMRVGAGISPAHKLHVSDGDNVVAKVQATDVASTASIVMSNDSIEFSHSVAGVNNTYRFRDETSGKDRYYLDTSGNHTFTGDGMELQSDIASSNFDLYLKGQDATHGGAIIGLNSAGSDGPLEFYTGSNKRAKIDEGSGAFSIGPANELVLYPQAVRPANGLPGARTLLIADNWTMELDSPGSDNLRLGRVNAVGTENMTFGGIGSTPIDYALFNADEIVLNGSTIYQNISEITPSFRSFRYEYNTIVGPVTVNNRLQFNNADPGLATKMYVDFDPLDKPASIESILENVKDDSIVYIFRAARTADEWMEIKITNTIVQTGYTEYDITVIKKQGATWANTTTICVNIYDPVGTGGGGSSIVPIEELFFDNFDSGSFGTNGWTTVNDGTNNWVLANADPLPNTGGSSYSAYISNDGSNRTYTNTTAQVSHLYVDIAVPSDIDDLRLKFDWICKGENDAGPDQYDFGRVFWTTTANTPIAGTLPTTSYTSIGKGKYNNVPSSVETLNEHIKFSAPDVASIKGTTTRLVFTWFNDTSAGDNPPFGIDNVRLTGYRQSGGIDYAPLADLSLYRTGSTQVVNNVTATATIWNWTERDATGLFDGTSTFTIAEDGYYEIETNLAMQIANPGQLESRIVINSNEKTAEQSIVLPSAGTMSQNVSYSDWLRRGTTIQHVNFQTTGFASQVQSSQGTFFKMKGSKLA